MKEFYHKYKSFILGILIVYCIALSMGIILSSLAYTSSTQKQDSGSVYLRAGWDIYFDGEQEATTAELPYQINDTETTVVDLYNTLPKTPFEISVLTFNFYQKNVFVYVEEQLIYEQKFQPKQTNAETPGSGKLFVYLPDDFEGKTIHIQLERVVLQDASSLGTVDIINGMVNARLFIPGDNMLFFVIATIFLIGIILLLISAAFKSVGVKTSPLVMLALFAISASLWFMCNSKIFQFFTDNLVLMHNLEYLSFYLMPVTLWAFLHLNWDSRSKATVPILMVMLGFFTIAITLKFLGICDMFRLLNIFHILVVINAIVFICFELRNFKQKTLSLKLFYVGIGFFFIGGFTDLMIFYIGSSSESIASNLVLGILLMGVCIMFSYVFSSKDRLKEHIESDMYKTLAYTDALTKISNRLIFENRMNELQANAETYQSICIINLDANGLKYTNDTYGHLQGDEMLKTIATELVTVFTDIATCYRIGGDEFCVIATNVAKRDLLLLLEKLDSLLAEKPLQFPISVSYGLSEYDSLIHDDIYEVFHNADDIMYENKRKYKTECEQYSFAAASKS